ncbi:MAG: D-Ala-D-Ala carboxypeptidase family metallohydrolase [Sediminibacterium sp.]
MAIDLEQHLSPHFTLHELLASQTATRKGIKEQFDPPQDIIDNLKYLSDHLLEKLRVLNGNKPLHLSSCYRCPALNKAVGGVPTSQHVKGQAADVDFGSKRLNSEFFNKIKASDLDFDQLLNEFDFSWVHISLKKADNRKQVLNITT